MFRTFRSPVSLAHASCWSDKSRISFSMMLWCVWIPKFIWRMSPSMAASSFSQTQQNHPTRFGKLLLSFSPPIYRARQFVALSFADVNEPLDAIEREVSYRYAVDW